MARDRRISSNFSNRMPVAQCLRGVATAPEKGEKW
jgi:hypothetical protein